jgi:squalene synthase HpnC
MSNKIEEISSGKNISYENFPVGSWLLPANLRPHIATFYHFARAADDIADSPNLSPHDKLSYLKQQELSLIGEISGNVVPPTALRMAASLKETKMASQYCTDLLRAFKQDVTKIRYNNWKELIYYCQLSAAPVGRYLIDLHGGFRKNFDDNYYSSDALCAALQILNHIQDCQDDYKSMGRVYLPLDMMKQHNVSIENLVAPSISAEFRTYLNAILDSVDKLIIQATKLPIKLKSRRLAMESQVIINIAYSLSKKLRRNDPILAYVKLSKPMYLRCFIMGTLKYFTQ